MFIEDVQNISDNMRMEIAKEFGIRSVLLVPVASGIIEVGSTEKLASAEDFFSDALVKALTAPPSKLQRLVEASSGGKYAMNWMLSKNGNLECKSWYNPRCRMQMAQDRGLPGLYTTRSVGYKFLPGDGMVGRIFQGKQTKFISDVQLGKGNKRLDLAKEFSIRSSVFIAIDGGIIEVGTNMQIQSASDFLRQDVIQSIAPN